MKVVFSRALPVFVLFFLMLAAAVAAPPTLDQSGDFPSEFHTGQAAKFQLLYKQAAGDRPVAGAAKMIIEPPTGPQIIQPGLPSGVGDPAADGVPITWTVTPGEAGNFSYHFEVTSSTGSVARFPADNTDLKFTVPDLTAKYVLFGSGMLIALALLPFVVYVGSRSINKRGDPASAARIALLIGVLATYALFLYLFFSKDNPLLSIIGGVVALALLIVLFTGRSKVPR